MIFDEIRCRTVSQNLLQMGYEWGVTPVIKHFTVILALTSCYYMIDFIIVCLASKVA